MMPPTRSVVIMLIVLFYQKGIMGDSEFSISGIAAFARKMLAKVKSRKGRRC